MYVWCKALLRVLGIYIFGTTCTNNFISKSDQTFHGNAWQEMVTNLPYGPLILWQHCLTITAFELVNSYP